LNQIRKWSDGAQAGTMIWIKRHTDSFYKLAFLITIFGLLFFIFSRSILGDDSPIVDGGVGYQTRQTLNNNQAQVVQRGYNEQKQYLQVFFDVRQKETGGKTTFDAKVVDTGRQKAVPAKIEKITDRYYVLNVQHVPQGWHHLAVAYGFVTKSQPLIDRTFNDEDADQVLSHQATTSDKVVQQVYRIDYRKMRLSDHLTLLSHDAYVAQYVRLELAQNKRAIQKIESHDASAVRYSTV
jgi:hypothetical protein